VRKSTKIWLVAAGTLLLCFVWLLVNVLLYVDIYVGVHPTQEQIQGLHAYGLFRQIVLLGGIAVIIVVGVVSAFGVAQRNNVPH
jgi:hypothetical protein